MEITIESVEHCDQRYDTVGDWVLNAKEKRLEIYVSQLDNWKMEFLVGFHELIEVVLCFNRGITGDIVDQFDMDFEKKRDVDNTSEPGDDPAAPYRKEHFFATSLERLMAAELGVDWAEYEEAINKLEY